MTSARSTTTRLGLAVATVAAVLAVAGCTRPLDRAASVDQQPATTQQTGTGTGTGSGTPAQPAAPAPATSAAPAAGAATTGGSPAAVSQGIHALDSAIDQAGAANAESG